MADTSASDIAIIGMAAHLPGARTIWEYWRNLRDGIEAVRSFTDEDLQAAGVPAALLRNPHYIKSGIVLDEMEFFDGEFFGLSPKESAIMDPQHRHFLECAWEALENAGHPPEKFEGPIGVFAGCGMGAYFMFNLLTNPDLVDQVGLFLLRHTGNDKDFLSTRVSYNFNLRGPSVGVQTACSTSLVATHVACQSLLAGECDLALSGGVTIEIPHRRGYLYHEGEILSPTGHCHAFDHRSQGTIFGSGAVVVVLRRLEDALADGDHVWAVLKGTAINNDGSGKVGYLAPSVDGQSAAMAEALAVADVTADSLQYVECHGTGTPVGDPIEISALTQAFRQTTDKVGYCAIGSVKTNIGHLDTAAGVASLIKVALSLYHQKMAPTLNFEAPNPNIDFEGGPFFVNDRLRDWPNGKSPRRAGVNSLGVGGTNGFAIVEEAPAAAPTKRSARPYQVLRLSARNRGALDEATRRLAAHLRENPSLDLADVAYTLDVGRRAFDQRRVLACRDLAEAIEALEANDSRRVYTHTVASKASLIFMFPGGGAQYVRMSKDLYESDSVFRNAVDRGLGLLKPKVDYDLAALLFPPDDRLEEAARQLEKPSVQLPALFIIEMAVVELLRSKGIQPAALIGHSMGENTAACVAGVLSYEDALGLVTLRGRLFDTIAPGGMLSVPLPPDELTPLLGDALDLATVNGPEFCVASGPTDAIDALQKTLAAREIDARRVPIHIAAHSRLLEPILAEFGAYLRRIRLNPPKIPFISNRTGTWITPEQATDPDYWVGHLRNTVFFAQGVGTLLETPDRVFLEVGPGKILGSLVKQHSALKPGQNIVATLRHPEEKVSDAAFVVAMLGRLWASGIAIDPKTFWEGEKRRRVPLPSYAFQRHRYWIEPGKVKIAADQELAHLEKIEDLDQWYYRPVWRPASLEMGSLLAKPTSNGHPQTWLIFLDQAGIGRRLVERFRGRGHTVITVREADAYFQRSSTDYCLSPEHGRDGYDALLRDLVASGHFPDRIVHLWLYTIEEKFRPGSSFFHRNLEQGFYSLFFLAQALGDEGVRQPLHISVVSSGMQKVGPEPLRYPEKSTVLGPTRVIPREFPGVTCSSIDLPVPERRSRLLGGRTDFAQALDSLADELEGDLLAQPRNAVVAYRKGQRFEQDYERFLPPRLEGVEGRIRDRGVYLITGGLGGLGLVMAAYLAKVADARLVLLGRSPLPERSQWDAWLDSHGPADRTSRRIREVRTLEGMGAEVLVVAADVTDIEQMQAAVTAARERFGAIHGVLHTAGVLKDDLIQLKAQADIEDVFTPKIHGTLVLDNLFRDQPLDFMVLFSSTSTVTAPVGQVDYVAANAFLNAYAHSRANGNGTHTIAVNWGVWSEVGMAAEAAGVSKKPAAVAVSEPAKHPLFESRVRDEHGRSFLIGRYSPKTHWVFDEHRTLAGHALLPGTGYIELARAALAEFGATGPFEIRDLYFFRPLHVSDTEPKEVRVKVRQTEEGYALEVQSKTKIEGGRSGWETHAHAILSLLPLSPAEPLPLGEIDARCQAHRSAVNPTGIRSPQEDHLRFGPRWRVLQQVSYGQGEALAQLELPEKFKEDLEHYALHPSLLDLATGYAMDLIEGYAGSHELWVPVSYRRIRVRGPLPRRLRSWIRNHGANRADREIASFDIVLTDEAGQVVFEAQEFAIKRLKGDADFAVAAKASSADLELEPVAAGTGNLESGTEEVDARQLSPAELAFQHNLSQGILPEEGTEALGRVLAGAPLPQIIVSSLDLHALAKQTEELATTSTTEEKKGTAKFERPQLSSEYVEPRDDIEKTLVSFWEDLLGVQGIGVADSFFDLGGHSLIAVRLFALIKKAFHVDFPMSVLFEAPTIGGCADLIRREVGTPSAAGAAPAETQRTRYLHLVAMHPGEGGPEAPFFLVAGMFGNVLNLRHLAHLIGADRPFYGLQARGLYGDHKPHETFEEMATDYLAEMRSVQPHGPYYLGGFSGGGITAFEIARQLREAGEQVATLVMLDTPLPISPSLSKCDKLMIHWMRVKRKGPAYFTEWASNRWQWEMQKLHRRLDGPVEEESSPTEFASATIEAAFRDALARYPLRHYPGKLILFRPKLDEAYVLGPGRVVNEHREFIFHDNGWSQFAGRVEVHEVPGDHDSMVLEPNVRVLSQKLRTCLEEAKAEFEGNGTDLRNGEEESAAVPQVVAAS